MRRPPDAKLPEPVGRDQTLPKIAADIDDRHDCCGELV
jgi:hypothetical protein